MTATSTNVPNGAAAKKEKQAKVAAAPDLWVPAINNWSGLGRWGFLEVTHMENAADLLRATFLDLLTITQNA